MRKPVTDLAAPALRMAERSGAVRVLVTGGSQGARALNRLAPAALSLLPAGLAFETLHQAGQGWKEETIASYRVAAVDAEVTEFIDDMAAAYGWADVVVCRSGALTVSELAAAGVAAAGRIAGALGIDHAISFDMGGTTTDVCLILDGQHNLGRLKLNQGLSLSLVREPQSEG